MSQLQKRAGGDNGDPFSKEQAQERLEIKPASFKFDIHNALAGMQDVELDEKQKKRGVKPLCCCGVKGCGIGPMTKAQETEEE